MEAEDDTEFVIIFEAGLTRFFLVGILLAIAIPILTRAIALAIYPRSLQNCYHKFKL